MLLTTLTLGAVLLGLPGSDEPEAHPPALAAYKTAAASAGRDAGAHIRLALWCEAHGLTSERIEQLSQALKLEPRNALANGLLGLVRNQGRWEKPEDVAARTRDDPGRRVIEQQYLERRAATPHTPQDQMKLAAWCEANRLPDQARAHYAAAARLDPTRTDAWKHLGYRKHGSRWVKPDQIAAEKQEALRQKQADRHWRPKLEKLRLDLSSKDATKRARAEETLAQITDPRAVNGIWTVFVSGGVRQQMAAIQMFGQIDGAAASQALAALAVLSPRPEVRGRAIETIMRRDPRDVVGRLIAMVHKPYKYQVKPVQGPGSPGVLFVEGERFNLQRFYQNMERTILLSTGVGRMFTPDIPFDPFSIQNMAISMGLWANNPLVRTPNGLAPSATDPIAPEDAAIAARAIAANPQNAQAILSKLIADPNNRVLPFQPGYTVPTTAADSIPVHLVPVPGHQNGAANGITGPPTGAVLQGMQNFARQVQATQNNPTSPLGMAIQLGKLEAHPNHPQDAATMSRMLEAEQQAAMRDQQLGQEIRMVQTANQLLQQQLAADLQFIEQTNTGIRLTNERVLPVLRAITGLDLGDDQERWSRWWMDQLGCTDRATARGGAKPTYQDQVTYALSMPAPQVSLPVEVDGAARAGNQPAVATMSMRACLAAGTLVRTLDGPRPIERIEVGDQVLCQDTSTGALEFQPVLATHRDEPASTMRIKAGGETFVATELHRFWKAGKGWTMARELKAGDRVRTIGGTATVESINAGPVQPTRNVEVSDNGDLFVGKSGVLVHDFGFAPAVPEPFDRPADLTTEARRARRDD